MPTPPNGGRLPNIVLNIGPRLRISDREPQAIHLSASAVATRATKHPKGRLLLDLRVLI
jgi:hypothetical protein